MVVTTGTFEQLVLAQPDRNWELHHGRPREKPVMSTAHNWVIAKLDRMLQPQLEWEEFQVRVNLTYLRRPKETSYIPDLLVIPTDLILPHLERVGLETYDVPMPLVVEVWSPSTGDYDIDEKIPEYQRRGDMEIWRIHPYTRTLTAWRRQADGRYAETVHREGVIKPLSLPNVTIDLAVLFG